MSHDSLDFIDEKKDDVSHFSPSGVHELDGWINQNRSSWIQPSPSIAPTPTAQISISNEHPFSSMSSSEERLRNKLKKSNRMLDMERNKNMGLQYELQNKESQLKAIAGSQSAVELSRQIQRLEKQVAYYRSEFEREREKRQESEDELEMNREENQRYAEQMDVLIFRHIPSVDPKFKDIGPVDFNIEEFFDSVGSYKLGEVLGEGYYGSVRIGSHSRSRQSFAIKVLNKNNIKRFKDLKQISVEIHVLKTYRHPNIVHLEEVVHAADNIYMVTELCHMDLHKYHNQIGMTLESARQVIFGILHPLCYLHANGVCHLDLKPENILLTQSLDSRSAKHQHVRLCDFGLVNMARKSDKNKDVIREGYACGTPGFYAPEMILQERFEGRTADMWSLGCIILEITLGFTQEWIDSYNKPEDNPAQFKKGLESCLREISIQHYPNQDRLLDIIHSCLSIEPSRRITSEYALGHAWLDNI